MISVRRTLHVDTVVREEIVALARHLDPSKVSSEARVVGRNEASSTVAARDGSFR